MRAMLLSRTGDLYPGAQPLTLTDLPAPVPSAGEILLKISVCGVCHTELDEIEGRMAPPVLPVIPGHQVVGTVERIGSGVRGIMPGGRVGVAWIASACGACEQCRTGKENLCPAFRATGRDVHGGYAEYMTARADFVFPLPEKLPDAEAAPLLCAGAIGYRSLKLTGLRNGDILGLTGFGASAHLVLKLVARKYPDSPVLVFARSDGERSFARSLGASWAGNIGERPPRLPQAIIDTTPAWEPLIASLAVLAPGGTLIINAIRKENADRQAMAKLDYPVHLWMEKKVQSVANVCRSDVSEFLALALDCALTANVQEFPLERANEALLEVKEGRIRGAKVLRLA